ncbi:hypothetical protein [Providencia sp. PROV197]|uniref:hypothetical protein n=1 Tax=Providencia sp. PROV197 TaxID=2949898 RepID=UPI00234A5269|nr:hypothetical protein [Providencia sp. PROV197]
MKKSILKSIIYASVIIISAIVIYDTNVPNNIVCRSSFKTISIKKNVNVSLNISYTLGDHDGWINLKGTFHNDGVVSSVARKVYVDVIKVGNSIKIRSKRNLLLDTDNSDTIELKKYLAQTYLNPGLDMDVFVYPQNGGGYIFFTNDMHISYCQ